MAKILLDIYPAKGHFHATLKIASILSEKGHVVIYGVTRKYIKEVERFGFESLFWDPVIVIPLKVQQIKHKYFYFIFNFKNNITKIRFKESSEKLSLFKNSIRKIKPDLVLLDEQNIYKAVFYKLLGVNVILFQTKPDIHKITGIPPITSFFIPNFSVLSTLHSSLLWSFGFSRNQCLNYVSKFFFFNQDEKNIYNKLIKEFFQDKKNEFDYYTLFDKWVKGIPRLIISPKAFDFPHAEKNDVFRVGPLIDIKREGQIQNPRYQSLVNKINSIKGQGLIIYCSMGTVSGNDLKRTLLFFKKVVKVASKNTGDLYILSTGKYLDINQLLPLPNNIFVFEQLPQVDLLQYCDLMITHGGMNSINECVYNEVPMLIYPLSLKWDQPGNSARAVYHGLGLRGRIERDSVKTISKKINQIKSNYATYKANVGEMKIKFDEQNNSIEVVQIIESFIQPQND